MQRLHPMGCHRALTAMDFAAISNRIRNARNSRNPALKASAKAGARRMLESMRELRLIIGADGYRLP